MIFKFDFLREHVSLMVGRKVWLILQEKVSAKMEADRNVMLGQFAHDRDSILADAKVEKEQLLREISAMRHEMDDQVISAENQRKEVCENA